MAYGSPSSPEDIRPYLEDIREGRPVSDAAVEELAERYRRIGGRSPLDEITERQRGALELELGIPVHLGMKHWRPRIAEAAEWAVESGATRVLGLVLAPHYSRLSIAGYRQRLEAGLAGRAELVFVESWHDHEPFLDVLADRVRGTNAHVVFTAHSLPERILAMGDPYKDELCARPSSWPSGPAIDDCVVRVPERERDRRAVARPGHRRPPRRPPRTRRPEGAGRSGRLRLRPPRDPLGHDADGAWRGRQLGLELDRIESLNDDPASSSALATLVRTAPCYGRRREHPQLSGLAGSPRASSGSPLQHYTVAGGTGSLGMRGGGSRGPRGRDDGRSAAISTSMSSTPSTPTSRGGGAFGEPLVRPARVEQPRGRGQRPNSPGFLDARISSSGLVLTTSAAVAQPRRAVPSARTMFPSAAHRVCVGRDPRSESRLRSL